MKPKKPTHRTEAEIIRFWKEYALRLHTEMSKNVTPDSIKLEFATWTDTDVNKLTKMIDRSFNEVSLKFYKQVENKPTLGVVNLASIKENKIIYAVFKANRDEHIKYFKKYPKYVRQKLTEHLEESKKSVTFDGKKIADAALPIAKALGKTEDIARRHANFIARDQLGKFTGSIHEAQALFVGAKRYIWRTVMDARVRPAHAAREGKTFSYNNPPAGGNPQIDYRCRCHAEAIIHL